MIKLIIFIILGVSLIALFGFNFSMITSGFSLFTSAVSQIGGPIINFFGNILYLLFNNGLFSTFLMFLLLLLVFDIIFKSFVSRGGDK